MGTEPHEFKPNWTIAPAETLREWISENGMTVRIMSVNARTREVTKDKAALLLAEVLDRKPLTDEHAEALERATMIPAYFWRNMETAYRAGLAAGLEDVSGDG